MAKTRDELLTSYDFAEVVIVTLRRRIAHHAAHETSHR